MKSLAQILGISTIIGVSSFSPADVIAPDSGVWSEGPRAYIGSTLAETPLTTDETYTFKTKLENTGDFEESVDLTGIVSGDFGQTTFYDTSFDLDSGASTIRGGTYGQFPEPGTYDVSFFVNGELFNTKSFEVIPEPSSAIYTLWTLPAIQLVNRKRKAPNRTLP